MLSERGTNILFLVVAQSHSGKTNITNKVIELLNKNEHVLSRARSFTTRNSRPDDLPDAYDFWDLNTLEQQQEAGNIIELNKFAGNFYGNTRGSINNALRNTHAINDVTEHAFATFKSHGYTIRAILIMAKGNISLTRDIEPERTKDDELRKLISVPYDLIVENAFEEGGFEKAVAEVAEYIRQFSVTRVFDESLM